MSDRYLTCITEADLQMWIDDLALLEHHIDRDVAMALADTWESGQPLILEGPPGGGKSSLAMKVARIRGASFYRMQCHKGLGPKQALYTWDKNLQKLAVKASVKQHGFTDNVEEIIYQDRFMIKGAIAQAITDPNPHTVLLIDEVDKIPADEGFEALLLEFLENNEITIIETGKILRPAEGKHVHVFITSNAGTFGLRESLSYPLLRRCRYIYLPEPPLGLEFEILRPAAPTLPGYVIAQCALFAKRAAKVVSLHKEIAISETIMWVQSLERQNITELTEAVIAETIYNLGKGKTDRENLIASIRQILIFINRLYKLAESHVERNQSSADVEEVVKYINDHQSELEYELRTGNLQIVAVS